MKGNGRRKGQGRGVNLRKYIKTGKLKKSKENIMNQEEPKGVKKNLRRKSNQELISDVV